MAFRRSIVYLLSLVFASLSTLGVFAEEPPPAIAAPAEPASKADAERA